MERESRTPFIKSLLGASVPLGNKSNFWSTMPSREERGYQKSDLGWGPLLCWLPWSDTCFTTWPRDIVRANIHWSSEPSLWPWPWIQQNNLSARHSSLWACTVKLNWSPQKISSSEHTNLGQTVEKTPSK